MMDFVADWFSGAVIVVGLVQWIKGLTKNWPTWSYAVIALVIAVGAAYCIKYAPDVYTGLGIWAVSQLAYELIIQKVKKTVE